MLPSASVCCLYKPVYIVYINLCHLLPRPSLCVKFMTFLRKLLSHQKDSHYETNYASHTRHIHTHDTLTHTVLLHVPSHTREEGRGGSVLSWWEGRIEGERRLGDEL